MPSFLLVSIFLFSKNKKDLPSDFLERATDFSNRWVLLDRGRESSFPYLSGDTWRFFCDWRLADNEHFNPEDVKLADTVFVECDSLQDFVDNYLPKIQEKFILITPNCERGSDSPLPGKFAYLLNNEKLGFWFLQNIDREVEEKIIPIPIGLANKIWAHGDINLLDEFIPISSAKQEKSILAYINFTNTNSKERGACLKHFLKGRFATITRFKSFREYLEDLSDTMFVISPPGNGLDCHRTWEALLMGCYPVVKHSTLDPLFEGLPVVAINKWSEVTKEFLTNKYLELQLIQWPRDKLFAPYWFAKVREYQQKLLAQRED